MAPKVAVIIMRKARHAVKAGLQKLISEGRKKGLEDNSLADSLHKALDLGVRLHYRGVVYATEYWPVLRSTNLLQSASLSAFALLYGFCILYIFW